MKEKRANTISILSKISPLIMIGIMAIVYLTVLRKLTFDQLLAYTPEEPIAAALIILLMYALKSLSFFFPMAIIAAVCGAILPIYISIPVNLAGIIIMATVPYSIGRFSLTHGGSEPIKIKNEKLIKIRSLISDNRFFSSFFLRIISVLPYDIVSLSLGRMGFSYKSYIAGTFLGTAPGIILTTIMGSAITEPWSAEFIIAVSTDVVLSGVSILIYRIKKRR